MVTKGGNFTGQPTPSIIDTEYEDCNFAQPEPVLDGTDYIGIRLFPGDDTSRTFTNCLMQNCEPPPGSTITRKCALMRRTVVVDTDTITVDGIPMTINYYANIDYGHYWDGEYVYLPVPRETPCEAPESS